MLENYSRVRLLTDTYQPEGASCFDVGYIIEVHSDDHYEVEFSDQNGLTTAQIVVSEKELQLAPPTFDAPKPNINAPQLNAEPIKEQQK